MFTKTTGELMDELMQSHSFSEYYKENSCHFISDDLHIYLSKLLDKFELTKTDVIRKSELSEVYGYQIFSGHRKPSRDSLLCICIAMQLSLNEIQSILKVAGLAVLYPKNERDSLIIIGINNHNSVAEINTDLYDNKFDTLN